MNTLWWIILNISLYACHAQLSENRLRQQPTVKSDSASSISLETTVPITVTDLASGQEMPGQRMDDLGQLVSPLPPGNYSFAATTPSGFAFVDRVVAPGERPVITLTSDCHRLHGRVTGSITLPATIKLSRISKLPGDIFVITLIANGQFVACLPQGEYSAQIEGASLSLNMGVVVPADASVVLNAYAASQVRQVPGEIKIANIDLATFSHSLRDRRVIGLGEANHGTGDFYTYREKLSLELARVGGLRSILLEADAVGMMAIDDYVMGANTDVAKAVVALRFWITDIQEFLTLLADVRAYNAGKSAADKIHVLGFDAQRLEPPVELLLAHRTELAISEHEADLLSRIAPSHGAQFKELSNDEHGTLSSLLDRLAVPSGQADLEGIPTRATIAARSIGYQLGYLSSTVGLRDQAMAELATYIAEQGGSRQVALWAHDGHIARQVDGARKSLGQYLSEKLKDAYFPIAFLSYMGAGRAWDKPGKIGVIPHDLAPTPPYNLETVIMNAARFVDVAWVRLDNVTGALAQWLALPRYVREFGSLYDPNDTQRLRRFPDSFAAVVVIQHASPSTPTPTGVRKITQ